MAIDIKQTDAYVNGSTLVIDETDLTLETTPLAAVPETAALDTVYGTKDGVPKQTPVSDLLADVESEISDIATPTYQYVSGNASIPKETITQVCIATIPTDGLWLIVSKMSFSSSSVTVYNHYIFFGNENTCVRNNMHSGGGSTNVYLGNLNAGTVISVKGYQTTDEARTCNADLALVRLGDSA